jgi:hypothetical protein
LKLAKAIDVEKEHLFYIKIEGKMAKVIAIFDPWS